MKKEQIETLAPYEVIRLISGYAMILSVLNSIPGSEKDVANISKKLIALFDTLPEQCNDNVYLDYRGCSINYCSVCKKADEIIYYSNGYLQMSNYKGLFLEAWEPKDKKVISQVEKRISSIRDSYNLDSESLIKNVQAEAKTKERDYRKLLSYTSHYVMRAQTEITLGKKVTVSNEFLRWDKPFYQLNEELLDYTNSTPLPNFMELQRSSGINTILATLTRMFNMADFYQNRGIKISYFRDSQTARKAWEAKTLSYLDNGKNRVRLVSHKEFKLKEDPRLQRRQSILDTYTDYFAPVQLIDAMYTIQQLQSTDISQEIINILTCFGLRRPDISE